MESLSKSEEKSNSYLTIGKITSPHGLQGAVKVHSLTDFPERFFELDRVFIFLSNSQASLAQDQPEVLYIRKVQQHPKHFIIYFKGLDNRTQAERINKGVIKILKEEAHPLPDKDMYYIHDLIGLEARMPDGERLGIVGDVYSPGQDILEIVTEGGKKHLIPFVKKFVPEVNIDEKYLVLELLDGLLEL